MGTKLVARAYLSYCQLEYIPQALDDSRYTKLQIVLVGILTTLCVTARNDFLILNKAIGKRGGEIERWCDGMKQMKWFHCCPEIPVDKNFLVSKRDEFFSKGQWWYDPSRRIARNHQNTSNYSVQYQSANHLEESAKWKLGVGPRLSAVAATEAFMAKPAANTSTSLRAASERGRVAAENQKAIVQKENDAISAGFKRSSSGSVKRKAGESVAEIQSPQSQFPSKFLKSPKPVNDTPLKIPTATWSTTERTPSFAQIREQIYKESDIVELQMRERSRIEQLRLELAMQQQRSKEAQENAANLRYLQQQGSTHTKFSSHEIDNN